LKVGNVKLDSKSDQKFLLQKFNVKWSRKCYMDQKI